MQKPMPIPLRQGVGFPDDEDEPDHRDEVHDDIRDGVEQRHPEIVQQPPVRQPEQRKRPIVDVNPEDEQERDDEPQDGTAAPKKLVDDQPVTDDGDESGARTGQLPCDAMGAYESADTQHDGENGYEQAHRPRKIVYPTHCNLRYREFDIDMSVMSQALAVPSSFETISNLSLKS